MVFDLGSGSRWADGREMTEMESQMLHGSLVALVTPFREGAVDEEGLRGLVRFHLDNGTDGLVPCGTTGEAATLTAEELDLVVGLVVQEVGGRIPVVAGTGTNNTAATVERTLRAKELGVDAALVVTPYYNKPTQEGLYQHYKTVAEAARMPIVVYNVPGRTCGNILPVTIERLAGLEEIVAVKEASGDLGQITELIGRVGDHLAVLSGDDGLSFPIACMGGAGAISVLGNLVPADNARLFAAVKEGRLEEARALHHKYHELTRMLFVETNPLPVKTALSMMGMVRAEFRLPLCPMGDDTRARLLQTLVGYGLVNA
jgi:4-hydroxy-tetrahydrodipicolinate synthase